MNTQKKAPASGAKSKQNKYPIDSDFDRIAAAALAAADSVLSHWLPEGKRHGAEWVSTNPTRSDASPGSFSVNVNTGKWSDFATNDKGGDLVSLIAYLDNCGHQSEAAARLADFLSVPLVEGDHHAPAAGSPRTATPKPEPERPITPIPPEAMATRPSQHAKFGKPSAEWVYLDADGRPLLIQRRFDPPQERKVFSPLTLWADGWKAKAPPEPRPLYGLANLAARPDAPVLLCEGEKSADAAGGLLLGLVCIATMNGAQSPEKSNFSPLRGRTVRIWPDADDPGAKFAQTAARLALDAGASSVELLDLQALAVNPITREPLALPKGWDAADAIGRGWNPDNLAPALKWKPFKLTPATAATTPKAGTRGAGAGLPDGFELIERDPKGGRAGLFFVQQKNRTTGGPDNGPHQTTERLWLADYCQVIYITRDHAGGDHGRTLEFKDSDGEIHLVTISLSMLAGSGEALRALLLSHGLAISTNSEARRRFMDFLLHSKPTARARITSKTGYHPGGAFVLPKKTLNPNGTEPVLFQNETGAPPFDESGTLPEWQAHVSRFASGNPLFLFSLSLAFAAPLVELVNGEGAIFHLQGKSVESSTGGKSSLARLAVSVCGAPDLFKLWRATDNALEATAEAHNDLLLTLDEIGQLDPKTTSDAIYLLTNGRGKQRAGRTGEARAVKTWRLFVLSTGEVSAEVHMGEATGGRKHRAGHGVRFIELIADAGRGMGAWANLHGYPDPAGFAKSLTDAAALYHGTALDAWLRWIIERRDTLPAIIREWQAGFVSQALAGITDPAATVRRVSEKFGLVAVAGELATEAGITAWTPGKARAAAADLFAGWLRQRGGAGNTQERALIDQVRAFLALNGEARFTDYARAKAGDDHAPRTANRAGFIHRYKSSESSDGTQQNLTATVLDDENGGRIPARSEFYVFREVFRSEIVAGYDFKEAEAVLIKAGILIPGKDRVMQKPRLPGFKNSPRVYVLTLDEPSEAHA